MTGRPVNEECVGAGLAGCEHPISADVPYRRGQ